MKFYKCKECGAVLIQDDPGGRCIDGMEELAPNTADAAGEKHVPVIETAGKTVTVSVGTVEHPMLDAHFIMWIVLETNQGYQKKFLRPGEKPAAQFVLAEGETIVAAYEYCNLHGLWKASGSGLPESAVPSEDAGSRFIQRDDVVFITNDKLCCARCVHVWAGSAAECEIYEQKPLSVLQGGDCSDLKER